MKTIHYQPIRDPQEIQEPLPPPPSEVISEVIFKHTSLDEALEELRREGYVTPEGEKTLKGIKDLLERIKKIRGEAGVTADSDGPVKSGAPMNRTSPEGSARIFSLSPQEALSLTADHFHKLESLVKACLLGI
jgi:hypothetical protein